VLEVVTSTVVDAPAANVALVVPDEAKTADWICATDASVNVAVCADAVTFVTRKTLVNVRADGTVPNASDMLSTLPLATGVDVPGCTAVPGEAEK
jgi:hypothetical protein